MTAILALAGGLSGLARMAVAALVVACLVWPIASWTGGQSAVATYQNEIATKAAQVEKERVADDARLRNLPDYDLCVRALSARRMPVDECDVLRGIP